MSDIKDGVFAQVSGTVGRSFVAKNGPAAVVEVAREGSQYPDRVTVWGLEAGEGDRVSVKGWASWRRREHEGKVYFDVSLNSPEVVKLEKAAPEPFEAEGWGNDSVPF